MWGCIKWLPVKVKLCFTTFSKGKQTSDVVLRTRAVLREGLGHFYSVLIEAQEAPRAEPFRATRHHGYSEQRLLGSAPQHSQ